MDILLDRFYCKMFPSRLLKNRAPETLDSKTLFGAIGVLPILEAEIGPFFCLTTFPNIPVGFSSDWGVKSNFDVDERLPQGYTRVRDSIQMLITLGEASEMVAQDPSSLCSDVVYGDQVARLNTATLIQETRGGKMRHHIGHKNIRLRKSCRNGAVRSTLSTLLTP